MGLSKPNSTSFKEGNKIAAKKPAVIHRMIKKMYENAMIDSDILCFNDACKSIGSRSSKIEYWVKKNSVFENYKKDIQSAIVSRINKAALIGKYSAAPSIWRMKQLGESDERIIDNRSTDGSMSPIKLDSETAKAISKRIDENI